MGKASENMKMAQSCADRETLQKSGLCDMRPAAFEAWSGPEAGGWSHTAHVAACLGSVAST
jgi:hypothetical protein